MSTLPPPPAKEIQEFQFKLLARLRIFKDYENVPLKQSLSLIAAASKFGLIFVGTPVGFDVIHSAKIIELCAGIKKPSAEVTDFPRRSVTLNAQPSHLDISCNGQHLAVGFSVNEDHVIRIYDVSSFTALTERVVHELRVPASLQALSWNPGVHNLLAACVQDGSAHVYELKNNSFDISSIPVESQSTCLCWSPKGKQIVIGSKNGALNQFKPDLKIVKMIPPPQGEVSVASVQWLSNFQYAVVYCADGSGASLVIINTPKNQPLSYVNYEDITYSNGNNRLTQFYFIHQLAWNVLVVASANSMEVGVLGLQGDWEQWQLEDAARAELPFSPSRQETRPIGMALDTSVQFNLPWGENHRLPPMPLLLLLSNEGVLVMYWTVNLLPDAAVVCEPPTSLPDISGLHLFVSADPQVIPQNERTSPQAQNLAQSLVSPKASSLPLASFATVSPTPTTPLSWQQSSVTANQPNWIATSTMTSPKVETKPPTMQSSWPTASTDVSAFMPSVTQSAFSASSAFGITASTTTPSAFSASATVPTSQIPFNFNASQTSSRDLFSKPGDLVSSSIPQPTNLPLPTTSVAPQVQIEAHAVPSPVPSPVPMPSSPEPEVVEESQELKAMNDAIIQDAIREEIAQFDQELAQLGRRVRNLKISRLNDEDLDSTIEELNSLISFMRELKDTTAVQDEEVGALRAFLVDTFAYVDSMRTRIQLQNNSDYSCIRSQQGLDPIMAGKMRDIKRNVVFLETQLSRVNSKLAYMWDFFQEGNKENRNLMQFPSVEAIYQTMVMYNGLIMKHKNTLDNLETSVVYGSHKRLFNQQRSQRMIDDNQYSTKDADCSKITEDFLSLNLGKLKRKTRIEDLRESVLSLDISESNLSKTSAQMSDSSYFALVEEILGDLQPRYLPCSNEFLRVFNNQDSLLPIVTSTPQSGSISSGHPVIQNNILNPPTAFKESKQTPIMNMKGLHETTKTQPAIPAEESSLKSPYNVTLVPTSTVFGVDNTNSPIAQLPTSSFGFASNSKQIESHLKILPNSVSDASTSLGQGEATTSVSKSSQAAQIFNMSGTTVSPPSVNTKNTTFVMPTPNTSKDLSFRPSSFSSPPNFTFNANFSQLSDSTLPQPCTTALGNTTGFITSVSTSSPISSTFVSSFNKTEPAKSMSAVKTPLKITSTGSTLVTKDSLPAASSPLASLSSLVSGIEPLESATSLSDSQKTQVSNNETSIMANTSKPFVFSVSNSNEANSTTGMKVGITTQNTNVLGLSVENKQESKETWGTVDSELKKEVPGSLNISSDASQPKSVFGGTLSSLLSGTQTEKRDQMVKSSFNFTNTPINDAFNATKIGTSSPHSQKSHFTETVSSSVSSTAPELQTKPPEVVHIGDSHVLSPIIEVSLRPHTSESDTKSTLERFSSSKNITITKVESPEKIYIQGDGIQSQSDSAGFSLFGSLSLGETPAKSQNIFGGSAPVKPIVIYEAATSKSQNPTDLEKKEERKLVETEVQAESIKPHNSFGGTTLSTSAPSTSFTFSTSTLQDISVSTENTQSQQNSEFSFTSAPSSTAGLKNAAFTFAQPGISQSSGPSFSFTTPSTSAPPTSAGIFGFGNLSVGFSEDKSKTSPSFEQQSKSAVSSSTSIFGGLNNKPTDSTVIFGKTTATSAESKSVFGQGQPNTVEKKTIFGQTNTNTQNNIVFGQTTTNTVETKNMFVQTTATIGENKNVFDKTSSGTVEPKSIFSQNATTDEKNVFGHASSSTAVDSSVVLGQIVTTTAENKNVFGQISSNTGESTSVFEQTPTTTVTESKSIFGQTITTTTENKNIFGQISPNTGESKSVFEQKPSTIISESKSIFGQAPGTTTCGQSQFSFSLSTSTATSQPTFFGTPSTSASFFGQPICSALPTVSSAFGPSSPIFGNAACLPFGGTTTSSPFAGTGTTTFGSKSSFGQSGGSFFGQTSGGFGSSGGSLFGGTSPIGASPVFGSSQPVSPFGQTSGVSGSIFGGGSFTTGGQSVGQTGFGTSAFQNKPASTAFGSTSPPAFGAVPAFGGAPTFGGSAAFGSPPKPFGGSIPSSPSAFGGSSQQSSTFENLANQNTMTFGNLAQNQSPGFGSVFGSPVQSGTSTTAFPPVTTSSVFGGSSFSSWR